MLEDAGSVVEFRDGAIIFSQGELSEDMYVIRSGRVKISRSAEGHDVVLATLAQGDFFGEMGLFGKAARSATATALGDTTLTRVLESTFRDVVEDPVVWEMLSRMARRIREIDESFERLSAKDRYIRDQVANFGVGSKWFD